MWGLAEEDMFWKVESGSHSLASLKMTAFLAHLKLARGTAGHLMSRYDTSCSRYWVVQPE